MKLSTRNHRDKREDAASAVPDGPPVRRFDCDRDCDTRWDREPRHTEACDRRWHEAALRVADHQREAEAELRAWIAYRDPERGKSEPGSLRPS